jgi:hypothetical protein
MPPHPEPDSSRPGPQGAAEQAAARPYQAAAAPTNRVKAVPTKAAPVLPSANAVAANKASTAWERYARRPSGVVAGTEMVHDVLPAGPVLHILPQF